MRKQSIRYALIPALVVAGALFAASPALAANPLMTHSAPDLKIGGGATSSNWSGYAVTGGTYTVVSAHWTQPAVHCNVTPDAFSSFWVGLDGDGTNSVEQTGTEADCSGGSPSYAAWYEMYPAAPVFYSDNVNPGDRFSAQVRYIGGGQFRLFIRDITAGWSHNVTRSLGSAQRGSAEVIAEAPSDFTGVLPLADFGRVAFTGSSVDGSLLTPSTPGISSITMASGGTVKAVPGAISSTGNFFDTWHHQ